MGSEQSAQSSSNAQNQSRSAHLQRGKSAPEREPCQENDPGRPGSISPGPSICSDSDLPYISYTVNRPIGVDSPKVSSKHQGPLQRGKSMGSSLSGPSHRRGSGLNLKRQLSSQPKATNNIVVVKPAIKAETTDKDPDLLKLQSVPMFLPIMRGTLNLPAVRDPEVLERLDPNGLLNLCLRYEQHLSLCSETVSFEQNNLSSRIRDIDFEISRLMTTMTERQRKYAKYAEKLGKVHEVSHQLNRCHMVLNQTLESMETLNNMLPADERLEPFVWTTG